MTVVNVFSTILVEGIHGDSKVRGVNLGGWLVVEGWIKPSLFEGILNGDMLVSFSPHFVVFRIIWRFSGYTFFFFFSALPIYGY